MQTANEIINGIIYLAVPVVIALSFYYYKKLEQSLPDKQRAALQEISRLVVHAIEQQYSSAAGENKRNYAISLAGKFFSALNIPMPAQNIIETAIEAAVFEMNMFQTPRDDMSDIFTLKTTPTPQMPTPPAQTQLPPSQNAPLTNNPAPGGNNNVA